MRLFLKDFRPCLRSTGLRVAIAARSGQERSRIFGGRVESLPSLIRFLIVVAAVAAIVYGVMVALVTYVTPQPRQMTYTIPAQRLNK